MRGAAAHPVTPELAIVNAYTAIALAYCAASAWVFYGIGANPYLGGVHLVSFAVLATNYVVFLRTRNALIATHVILSIGTWVVVSLFATGGWAGTGYLWPFAYLPYAFFLAKRPVVDFWVGMLFASCLLVVGLAGVGVLAVPYSAIALFNYFAALTVFSFCMFLFVHARDKYAAAVETGRAALNDANQQLRASVSMLSATLESTTDGILVIDRARRITGYNSQFAEMWRIPAPLLKSGHDDAVLASVTDQLKDPATFLAKVQELYADPESKSFDELEFKDGRIFERTSMPQRQGTEVTGRVWSFRDVTQKRRADKALLEQNELQMANQRLRDMDRMKTQFINNAAHELGTPLTPITVQAHMLSTEKLGPLSERQRTSVTVLSRNVDR
jgi:PAS domain-containing protein